MEEDELEDEDETIDPGHVPGVDYDTPPKEVRPPGTATHDHFLFPRFNQIFRFFFNHLSLFFLFFVLSLHLFRRRHRD